MTLFSTVGANTDVDKVTFAIDGDFTVVSSLLGGSGAPTTSFSCVVTVGLVVGGGIVDGGGGNDFGFGLGSANSVFCFGVSSVSFLGLTTGFVGAEEEIDCSFGGTVVGGFDKGGLSSID